MTLEEFREIYAQAQIQGISGKQYCRENDITYNQWVYWRKKLLLAEDNDVSASNFINIQNSEMHSGSKIIIESPTGWKVHVESDLNTVIRMLSA